LELDRTASIYQKILRHYKIPEKKLSDSKRRDHMSRTKFANKNYASFHDFYTQEYGEHINQAFQLPGDLGTLVDVSQPAGDFSDAALPEHLFTITANAPVWATFDFGNGRRRDILKNSTFSVVRAETPTSIIIDGNHSVVTFAVRHDVLHSLYDGNVDDVIHPANQDMVQDDLAWNLMRSLEIIARQADSGATLLASTTAAALFHAAAHCAQKPKSLPRTGCLADWQVKRVCDMIDVLLTAQIGLKDLADAVGLSPFHFCRSFKVSTGYAPHQFQVARRVDRAREMLIRSDSSVTEIAAAVGYDDPNQLARVFRKSTGMSPSQFRRERR
jgi:AraC family transcriptional regulator